MEFRLWKHRDLRFWYLGKFGLRNVRKCWFRNIWNLRLWKLGYLQ
ncbi:hypothetical protein HanIR_Chr03g0114791 [Helianthus annuus]|nr:hypothetical protein HanIR_Chr03g0114791 [Helianthus annuus]